MILQYTDIFGDGKPHKIKAEITTEHSASSYGMPVVVLPDGHALDATSWTMLGYQIIKISRAEAPMMERWLTNLYAMLGMSAIGRKGGSAKSEAKTKAARENAKKGGYPKGRPRNTGLTALQRQAWDLRQQGLGIKDIAAQMGRQSENVRQLLARAASKLSIPGGWAGIKSQEV